MDDEDEYDPYDPKQSWKSVEDEALDHQRMQAWWRHEVKENKRQDLLIVELQTKIDILRKEVDRLQAACFEYRERCNMLEVCQLTPSVPDPNDVQQYKQLIQTYKDLYDQAMKQLDARG